MKAETRAWNMLRDQGLGFTDKRLHQLTKVIESLSEKDIKHLRLITYTLGSSTQSVLDRRYGDKYASLGAKSYAGYKKGIFAIWTKEQA